ncbi:MAG: hypothetical protein U5R49_24545 [Deltaproteobacteria bacterium]|nr:hypothetical protein [Deltaproteobacteria bacterium]
MTKQQGCISKPFKTSFVYFDDAEREMDQIAMLKDNEPVKMTSAEWETIQAFYREFVK